MSRCVRTLLRRCYWPIVISISRHHTCSYSSPRCVLVVVMMMLLLLQAYTSQFVALVLFALVMCEDKISVQPRRNEILKGLQELPGETRCGVVWETICNGPGHQPWWSTSETICGGL